MAAVHPTLQEARLPDSGALYRLLADTIPFMVWTADAAGSVDFVNQRVLEYTGMQARALEGWDWEAIVHPDDRENSRAILEAARFAARRPRDRQLRRFRCGACWREEQVLKLIVDGNTSLVKFAIRHGVTSLE